MASGPFQDTLRWFMAPQGVRTPAGRLLSRADMSPDQQEKALQLWHTYRAKPLVGGFSTPQVKMRPSGFGQEDRAAMKEYQDLLKQKQLEAIKMATAAAKDAAENYGKFFVRSGLGIGFGNQQYDTSSPAGRTAFSLEILQKALAAPAPPTTISDISRTTPNVGDYVRKLMKGQGGDIDPDNLSIQARENLGRAIPIAAALLGKRGF